MPCMIISILVIVSKKDQSQVADPSLCIYTSLTVKMLVCDLDGPVLLHLFYMRVEIIA